VLFHGIEFSQTHIYCTQSKDHHLPVYHHTRSFKVSTFLSFKKAILKIISIKLDAGNEVLSLTNPIFEKTCPDDDMDAEIKTPEASNFHVPFQELGSSEEGSKQSRQLFVTPATLWRENWIWNQQEDVHSAEEDSVDLENEDCPADTSPEFDENVCDEFLQALVDCGGV
jgi:hypothetical protein